MIEIVFINLFTTMFCLWAYISANDRCQKYDIKKTWFQYDVNLYLARANFLMLMFNIYRSCL